MTTPQQPKPDAEGVWVPLKLYHSMATCFYGNGPRFGGRRDPAPAPAAAPEPPKVDPDDLSKGLTTLRPNPRLRPTGAALRRYGPPPTDTPSGEKSE